MSECPNCREKNPIRAHCEQCGAAICEDCLPNAYTPKGVICESCQAKSLDDVEI